MIEYIYYFTIFFAIVFFGKSIKKGGNNARLSTQRVHRGVVNAPTQEVIAKMEDMIYQWKIANGGQKLPKEFFELQDVEKMSKWLRRELK